MDAGVWIVVAYGIALMLWLAWFGRQLLGTLAYRGICPICGRRELIGHNPCCGRKSCCRCFLDEGCCESGPRGVLRFDRDRRSRRVVDFDSRKGEP